MIIILGYAKEKPIDKNRKITMAYIYNSKFDENQVSKIDILNYSFGTIKNNKLYVGYNDNLRLL